MVLKATSLGEITEGVRAGGKEGRHQGCSLEEAKMSELGRWDRISRKDWEGRSVR